MAEITINGVKYTNVPNKKAGTKFAASLTQSNIGASQAIQDYVNSAYFYPLVNAIDINWNGVEVDNNSYINSTSDLITYIARKGSSVDLTSYATKNYVDQKIEDVIGGAPETLDTLKELADALADDASLAYVTQALDGKADKSSLADYATNSYVTAELDKKVDKTDIPVIPDMSNYVTVTAYNMLVQRVDELANLIAYYHPAQPEQPFEGYWTLNGMRTDNISVSTSDPIMTLSFVSNPTISSGIGTWTFKDSQPGISINTMTGEMTITPSMLMSGMVYSGVGYDYSNNGDYHSLYITINVTSGSSKQSAMGQWLNSSSMVENNKTVVAGDSTTYTFTFSGTPSDNWSFTYMADVSGISFDTMTGTITIDMTNSVESTTRYMYLNANRPEDSTYYNGSAMFNVKVLPNGTNPDFYYDQPSVNISNTVGVMTPMLYDSISSRRGYVSSDESIATVSSDGSINYVSNGTCTVTATAYDSSDNVLATATITVYCETMKSYPSASWSGRDMYGHVVVNAGNTTPVTCVFNGTPLSGWTAQPSPDAGITIDSSTMNVTVDATHMTPGEYNVYVSYPEDANYYSSSDSLYIRIIPAGANPNFYFTQDSISLAPENSPYTASIQSNNNVIYKYVSFVSDNTSVATVTVNNTGMMPMQQCDIIWQGEGTATITATAYDDSDNVLATASLSVTCTAAQPVLTTPSCHWSCNGVDYNNGESTGWTVDEERTDTFTFTGTPASGWTFNYPTGTGITANTTTGEFTIDTTAISSKGTYTLTASYPGDSTYSSAQYSITITLEKRATASWKDENDVVYTDQYDIHTNDIPSTLTFNGTPSTGWTFTITTTPAPGIIVGEASGDITFEPVGDLTPGTYWINAEYPEDATYSNTSVSFAIVVYDNESSNDPTGQFYLNGSLINEDSYTTSLRAYSSYEFSFSGTPNTGWTLQSNIGTVNGNTVTIPQNTDGPDDTPSGQYTITATYPGDSTYNSKTIEFIIYVS